MQLILTGATGVAGLAVYRAALADTSVTKITILSRRAIPSWAVLPDNASSKTEVIIQSDFHTYTPELARKLAAHDACVWALGKSAIGMDEKAYTEMTLEYPLALLNALKDGQVGEGREEGKPFRFVFISGHGADPTGKSMQMWARVKGRTENEIIEFCNSTPGMKAHIIRPGYFFPPKEYPEDRKHQRSASAGILDKFMTPVFGFLTPSLLTPTGELGSFAVNVAKGQWSQQLFSNKDLRELSKQSKQ